ncbi:unnamed protein product [Dicrocoelium dendriticum]|nr:unnamed protein product [Dicrocoelium dendriticum]
MKGLNVDLGDAFLILKELEDCCTHTRSHYLEGSHVKSDTLSKLSVSSESASFKDFSMDFLESNLQFVSEQLDKIFDNATLAHKGYPSVDLWMSFALRDLEIGTQSIAQECIRSAYNRVVPHFRLGRMYAWARDQLSIDADDVDASRLRLRLRRRLARLVWLVRASKRRGRLHPMLVSLKHELLKIRTRSTGRLLSDNASCMELSITWKDGLLPQLGWEQAYDVCLKQVVPSHFHNAFELLIDRITDLFLELPAHVPGVSISDVLAPPSDRKECYRELVARLILSFYNHLDPGSDLAAENGDEHEGFGSNDLTAASDSETEVRDGPNLETGSSTVASELNPAYVQAALDRFDHYCRSNRKRTIPSFAAAAEEDRLAIDTMTNSMQPMAIDPPYMNQDEDKADVLPHPMPVFPKPTESDQSDYKGTENTEESNKELPLDENPVPPDANVTIPEETHETANNLPLEKVVPPPHPSSSSSKRRTNRSLRTRRSRTPSDASYSEGEVLSDSEEERADSLPEVEGQITEIGERTNIDIEEEEAEELIRMVNDQLRDPTPASDIDLTELEIMDEWAPPTSSLMVASRSDTFGDEPTAVQTDTQLALKLEEVDKQLASLLKEAEELCGSELNALVLQHENAPFSDAHHVDIVSAPNTFTLSEDTEASIERTASAFKEHVTSVLANLLHAMPTLGEAGNPQSTSTMRQVITGRRGSRLLGMLRAYRQDVVKRMNVSVT